LFSIDGEARKIGEIGFFLFGRLLIGPSTRRRMALVGWRQEIEETGFFVYSRFHAGEERFEKMAKVLSKKLDFLTDSLGPLGFF
jgi:hypothetical protein